VPNLKVVTVGNAERHTGELLASNAMTEFLDRLGVTFPDHLIIIDTPPLLAVTETRTLVQQAGQIVMVVAAGVTPRKAVEAAVATLPAGCSASLVLNKASQQSESSDYYYDY
jgi:Mrp family chromosome partitioning ATPase